MEPGGEDDATSGLLFCLSSIVINNESYKEAKGSIQHQSAKAIILLVEVQGRLIIGTFHP